MPRVSYFRTTTVVDNQQTTQLEQLLTKSGALEAAINSKADKSYVDTQLANVPDATYVTQQLATKIDASSANTLLAAKADQATVTTALAAKADKAVVDAELATKASKAEFDARKQNVNEFLTAFKDAIYLENPAGSGTDFNYAPLLGN